MKKPVKINTKKVLSFLGGINMAELRFCELQMSMAKDARNLVGEFNISKVDFSNRMDIPIRKYESFLKGAYPFSLEDMAKMQAYFMELAGKRDLKIREREIKEGMTDVIKQSKKE